jgi:hypothetical protein
MALSYKNIVITTNTSNTSDPKIVFSGANTTVNTDITMFAYPTSGGTLSFEGSAGQLFSISNSLSGTLFSVNDISGIPSVEVLDTGTVRLAPYSGVVGIGLNSPLSAYKLHTYGQYPGIGIQTNQPNAGTGGGWIDFLAVNNTVQGNIYFNEAGGYLTFGTAASGSAQVERMRIGPTGAIRFSNVYGVTVTTPRNMFIDASGNVGGISSIRASKTNIASMPDANWVLDLNPVTFNYRKKDEDGNFTEDFDSEKMYGLIAEDAAEVNSDICIYNEVDGQQVLASIHYDRLIGPIIKVLKDQQAMIEALQAKVTELQGV